MQCCDTLRMSGSTDAVGRKRQRQWEEPEVHRKKKKHFEKEFGAREVDLELCSCKCAAEKHKPAKIYQ